MKKEVMLKLGLPILLLLTSLFVFYPGSYSGDSWSQYNSASAGDYQDWFGTGFTFIWRVLLSLTGDFSSIFYFQMILYWLFFYFLLNKISIKNVFYWVTYLAAIFFLFIPQYVMRDSLGVILLGFLVLSIVRIEKVTVLKIGLVFLLSALILSIRINFLIALIPLFYLFFSKVITRKAPLIFIAVLSPLLALVLNNMIDYHILKANKNYPEYKLRLLDISGLSILTDENLFPKCITEYSEFDLDKLTREYSPASIDDLYWSKDGTPSIFIQPDSNLNVCLKEAWKNAVKEYPILYLQNRFEGFLYFLKIKRRFEYSEYWNAPNWVDSGSPFEIKTVNNETENNYFLTLISLFSTPLFSPWFWFLLNTIALIIFWYKYRKEKSIYFLYLALIQLSGVLYVLSQILIYQHDRDFRYSYFNVFIFFFVILAFNKKDKLINTRYS